MMRRREESDKRSFIAAHTKNDTHDGASEMIDTREDIEDGRSSTASAAPRRLDDGISSSYHYTAKVKASGAMKRRSRSSQLMLWACVAGCLLTTTLNMSLHYHFSRKGERTNANRWNSSLERLLLLSTYSQHADEQQSKPKLKPAETKTKVPVNAAANMPHLYPANDISKVF